MHGFLTGVIGTGSAVAVAGVAWIAAKHRGHAPGVGADDFIFAGCVIMMLLAGDLTVATGVGRWVTSILRGIVGYAGPVGLVLIGLVALWMLVKTVLAVLRKHNEDSVLRLAFVLPLLLAMFPAGDFHRLSVALAGPANTVALAVSHAFGVA